LTARTASQRIIVKETEIMPLPFIFQPDDKYISIVPTSGRQGMNITLSFAEIVVAAVNIEKIRKDLFLTDKCLYGELCIIINGHNICTYCITPSLANELRYFRFRNSLGAYERIEISGLIEYIPETDAETFLSYDEMTDEYQHNRDRLKASHVYEVEIGYKSSEDLYAILDLIQSGDVWIFSAGSEYACIIESSGQIIASDNIVPGNIDVTVRLKDESLAVEFDPDDLLEIISAEWLNPICREYEPSCDFEWLDDDAVCQLVDAIVTETVEFAEYVCQMTPESKNIAQTNVTTGSFISAAMGQDGKLYFCGYSSNGIMYLDNDGVIKQTNVTTGSFISAAIGQDRKLYFCSSNGIMYLDDDGLIKQTNVTTGSFSLAAMGQDGKLYFGSFIDGGIMYLDNDGVIKQTNATTGSFSFAAMGQDGKLYFGSYVIEGIIYLDNDGVIKQTNVTTGGFHFAAMGQDGKLYFCGYNDGGIMYLDNDGVIKQTNVTTGDFHSAAMGQDGKLYFCNNAGGIMYLDNDGVIKQTNVTIGSFFFAAMGQDRKLYFGGYNDGGIMYLDDDGLIKQTNATSGSFIFAAMGQDGKLYFCGYNAGLYRLDWTPAAMTGKALASSATYRRYEGNELVDELTKSLLTDVSPELTAEQYRLLADSDIESRAEAVIALFNFETSPEYLSRAIITRDACFPSMVLTWDDWVCQPVPTSVTVNTGYALGKSLIGQVTVIGAVTDRFSYSILDAFGDYEALTEMQYSVLSDDDIRERAQALIYHVSDEQGIRMYTVTNEVIEENTALCPLPPEYVFEFSDGDTVTEHAIQYDGTFTDTVVSTKDGSPAAFTVLSKPAWATVTFNGNVATVSGSNTGAYREGEIVYQQTESGHTIISSIKQYGTFGTVGFSLGIGKSGTGSAQYPGFPPEDYGVSFDFVIKVDGVEYTSGSRSLAVGNTATVNQSLVYISGYNYAKTIEVFISNPAVSLPGKAATIEFGDDTTYSVMQGYITDIEVDSNSAYIRIEDRGGMSQVGGFVIKPLVEQSVPDTLDFGIQIDITTTTTAGLHLLHYLCNIKMLTSDGDQLRIWQESSLIQWQYGPQPYTTIWRPLDFAFSAADKAMIKDSDYLRLELEMYLPMLPSGGIPADGDTLAATWGTSSYNGSSDFSSGYTAILHYDIPASAFQSGTMTYTPGTIALVWS
jgi:hypothetical protein